jgi:hypothetical protein
MRESYVGDMTEMNLRCLAQLSSLAICSSLILTPTCMADDSDSNRATLRGLPGVFVVVDDLDKSTIRKYCPMDAAQLKTDAELRLRKGGISVLSADQLAKAPGKPILSITVTCSGNEEKSFSSVMLLVGQEVVLARDPTVHMHLTTWSVAGGTGMVRIEELERNTRDKLADQVDKFLNAYLAANAPIRHQ